MSTDTQQPVTDQDTPQVLLTDQEMIDLAGELGATPLAEPFAHWQEMFGPRVRTIAGSPQDQAVPEGTSNPYWELIRRFPSEGSLFGLGAQLEPNGFWAMFGSEVLTRAYTARLDMDSLQRRYAWSIPSPGDIAWIAHLLAGRGIVEIGAGGGYWAWQLRQAGLDVIAYDPREPGPSQGFFGLEQTYTGILRGDHTAAAWHPDRALMLCWPSRENWAAQALKLYRGDLLIYLGEERGQMTADDEFFDLRDDTFEYAGSSPFHVAFLGIHCALTAWRRKPHTPPPASGAPSPASENPHSSETTEP